MTLRLRHFLITLLAILGICSIMASAQVAVPPFYEKVMKMRPDGKLGQVIMQEEIHTDVPGAQAWRIAYISSDIQERKTIATGLVMAPLGKAPADGRPVIAWAHGTTGTAQNCGPSEVLNPAQPLNQYFLVGGNSWTDYGLPSAETFIKEGYVVVGTDYQGLGGGGKHEYSVAATNARDVINSARAVGTMKAIAAGKKAIVYGWSQGGGTALAAASLKGYIAQQGTARDGIEFLGFVALAPDDVAALTPKTQLDEASAEQMLGGLEASFGNNVFNFTHFSMFVWGTVAAFPGLKLNDIFTDEGAKAIDKIMSDKCVHAAADTLNYTFGPSYKSLLRDKAQSAKEWATAFVAGSVPPVKPVAPVIIYWGTDDTVVPPVMGKIYREQMCKAGANITRVQLPGKQTHFSTPSASAPLYLPWIKDRVEGKQLADGCAAEIVAK